MLAVRKPGKLPGDVLTESYELEYGSAALQLNPDDVPDGARVLIVDDVLATGGTAAAAAKLLLRAGAEVVGVAVVTELPALRGRFAVRTAVPDLMIMSAHRRPLNRARCVRAEDPHRRPRYSRCPDSCPVRRCDRRDVPGPHGRCRGCGREVSR